jgi:putative flippase GtrA
VNSQHLAPRVGGRSPAVSPDRQFTRFLAAGAFAAGANVGSRILFSRWLTFESAVLCAFVVGLVAGFALMRTYVFAAGGRSLPGQVAWFVGVNLLGLAQTFLISVTLAQWALPALGIRAYAEVIGHFAGVITPIVTSYFGHRLITFR